MTCGKKHCDNNPTEATRVEHTEVEGRPLCDHPGCDKRVVGTGEQCADGHVQGGLVLQPYQEQALLALRQHGLEGVADAAVASWHRGQAYHPPTLPLEANLQRALTLGNREAEMLARATGRSTGAPPTSTSSRNLTQLSDGEFRDIRDRAIDWQYLTVLQEGMATKSKGEDWLIAQYNLTRAAAHQVLNHIEAHDHSFRIARDHVQWVNRERPAPTELPGFALHPTPAPASGQPHPPTTPQHVAAVFAVTEGEWAVLSGEQQLDRSAALRNSRLLRAQGKAFLHAPQAASREVNQEGFRQALTRLHMALHWAQHAQDDTAVTESRELLLAVERAWQQYTVPPTSQQELLASAQKCVEQGWQDAQRHDRPALPALAQALAACALDNSKEGRLLAGEVCRDLGYYALYPRNPNRSAATAQAWFTQAVATAQREKNPAATVLALESRADAHRARLDLGAALADLEAARDLDRQSEQSDRCELLEWKIAGTRRTIANVRLDMPTRADELRGQTLYYSDEDTGRRRRWGIVREETAEGKVRVYNPNDKSSFEVASADLLDWMQQLKVYRKKRQP